MYLLCQNAASELRQLSAGRVVMLLVLLLVYETWVVCVRAYLSKKSSRLFAARRVNRGRCSALSPPARPFGRFYHLLLHGVKAWCSQLPRRSKSCNKNERPAIHCRSALVAQERREVSAGIRSREGRSERNGSGVLVCDGRPHVLGADILGAAEVPGQFL